MGRAPCCDKANVKRGPWSPEEDTALKNYVEKYGTGGNWIALPHKAGLKRCGKSCRLRWLNYLRPDIKHGAFTEEEDKVICTLYKNLGSRWSVIASHLPGRTDNDVKNYWNTKLKKKLMATKDTASNSHIANIHANTTHIPIASPSSTTPPVSTTSTTLIGYNFAAAQVTENIASSSSLPLHYMEAGSGYNSLDSQKLFQDPPPFPSLPEVLLNNFSVSSSSSLEASISSLPAEENYIAWSGNGGSDFDNILMDFSYGSSHYDHLMSSTGYGFPEKADHEATPLNPVNFGNYSTLVAAADNKAQGVYQYCHIR